MKQGNFFVVKNQIFDFALSPVCFVVYCYLCKCRNKKNGCYPSKRTILNELIERIVVHEKTVDENGSKSQRVDIYYKFVGYIR